MHGRWQGSRAPSTPRQDAFFQTGPLPGRAIVIAHAHQSASEWGGRLRAAHAEHRERCAEARNAAQNEDRHHWRLEVNHRAADERSSDRPDAADAESPADAGRPNEGRIERRGERIGADLSSDDEHSCKGRSEQQNARLSSNESDQPNEHSGEEIRGRKHTIEAKAVNEESQHKDAGNTPGLKQAGGKM